MRFALVTGANRGLGLALVKELLKYYDHVIATFPQDPDDLNDLNDSRTTLLKMDVSSDESIAQAYNHIVQLVGSSDLCLLVNNAGILVPYQSDQNPARQELVKQIDVNAVSVAVVSQKAAKNRGAKICNISSDMASMGHEFANYGSLIPMLKDPLGLLGYRMSKAAMNSLTKTMAMDLASEGILTAAYHPGWVRTQMGGSDGHLSPEQFASSLVKCFQELDKMKSGGYYNWEGQIMPY